LLNAETLNDLVVHSEERKVLWQALRERASQTQSYVAESMEIDFDPVVLATLLGVRELEGGYEAGEVSD
jgi:hypothetical protein